jgi:hypothetical protein
MIDEDQLAALMSRARADVPTPPLDLAGVRRRGRRLRRWRTGAAVAAVAAVTAGTAGVTAQLVSGDEDGSRGVAAQDHQVTDLTPYERRVLEAVPGSFAVDGTVVVPGHGEAYSSRSFSAEQLAGAVRPLGFHTYAGGAIAVPGEQLPRFMEGNHGGSQVVADQGPASLTCTTWEDTDGCVVSVVAERADGRYAYVYGLGTDSFLEPGAEMEVFTDEDYSTGTYRESVIGGFDGTDAVRVVLELVDGREVEAELDSGGVSAGNTLFWGTSPVAVEAVEAYDAKGDLVESHTVRACSGGVDCEVR